MLLQERRDVLVPVVLKAGTQFQNRHGLFSHDAMIGKEFGSKVRPPDAFPAPCLCCCNIVMRAGACVAVLGCCGAGSQP